MFCPKCGKEIEGTPSICPLCNQDISGNLQVEENENPPVVKQGKNYAHLNKKNQTQYADNQSNEQVMDSGYVPPVSPSAPIKPKKAPRTGILMPVISMVLAILLLVSSVFATFATEIDVTKASPDKITNAVIGSGQGDGSDSGVLKYDASKITKPAVTTSVLDGLVSNSSGAQIARQEIAVIEAAIAEAEAELENTYPEVTSDSIYYYLNKIRSVASDLYLDDNIKYYESNSDCIIFELNSGGYYIYAPHIEGYDAGSEEDAVVKVSTYQPQYGSGHYEYYDAYSSYAEDSAKVISAEFDTYIFKNEANSEDYNNDNGEVDFSAVAKLGEYGVALWHGHGTYSYNHGPLLFLGMGRSSDMDAKYYSLFKDGTILWSKNNYVVGSEFVKKCVPDGSMENTVLYLGTCKSGYNSQLAQAFIDKGAKAVYTVTGNIDTGYNATMMKTVATALSSKKPDGTYYSVFEALEYAKTKNGSSDNIGEYNAQIALYTKENFSYEYDSDDTAYTLDWYKDYVECDKDIVVLLDVSYNMNYSDMFSKTKDAAIDFINTVIDDNSRVSLVAFGTDAQVINDFSVRKAVIEFGINNLTAYGSMNMDDGIKTAEKLLRNSNAENKIIVMISAGYPDEGRTSDALTNYAKTVRNKGITIYTLGMFQGLSASEKAQSQKLLRDIATEGMDYEVMTSNDIAPFLSDISENIAGQKFVHIEIACPADVIVEKDGESLCSVKNQLKTHCSFGTLSFRQMDVNDYSESLSGQRKILRLKDGVEYDIKIEGNGNGNMNYTIRYMDENGKYADNREFANIKITSDTVIETVASSMRNTTVLSIDENGDGNFDKVQEAKSNGKGMPVDDTLHKVFFYLNFVCGALLLAAIAFLIIRLINRKRV